MASLFSSSEVAIAGSIDKNGVHPQRHRNEAAAKGGPTKRERGELKEAAAKGAATRERGERG